MKLTIHGSDCLKHIELNYNMIKDKTISEMFNNKYKSKIKNIQIYCGFCVSNLYYNGYMYYPVIVVFKDKEIIDWIKWKGSEKYNLLDPFSMSYNLACNEIFTFYIADDVPEQFHKIIEGKDIYFDYAKFLYTDPSIEDIKTMSSAFNQFFIDELSRQITPILEQISGYKNLAKTQWEVSICTQNWRFPIYNVEGYSYKCITLQNKYAVCVKLWIRWKSLNPNIEYYAVSDYVTKKDIIFEICEDVDVEIKKSLVLDQKYSWYKTFAYNNHCNDWIDFIKNSIPKKKEKSSLLAIDGIEYEISCGWPDVFMDVHLNKKATKKAAILITDSLGDFINTWNEQQEAKDSEQVIHYFAPIENEDDEYGSDKQLKFHIDFGSCEPEILKLTVKHLSTINVGIKRIMFN